MTPIFNALAEARRRQIIELLAQHGQLSATNISSHFTISPPAISQHLKILKQARLVQVDKRAQQRIYHLNPDALSQLETWAHQMQVKWNQRFDRLDQLLTNK